MSLISLRNIDSFVLYPANRKTAEELAQTIPDLDEIYVPDEGEVFVDWDYILPSQKPEELDDYIQHIVPKVGELLLRNLAAVGIFCKLTTVEDSRTPNNTHITYQLFTFDKEKRKVPIKLDDGVRIAIQLLLGSDLSREIHGIVNHLMNLNKMDGRTIPPTMFFTYKAKEEEEKQNVSVGQSGKTR